MIITGIIEGTNSNHQCYPGAPFVSEPYNQHIQNKKLKEHKGKPIASLHCPQLMEKEWGRSQKKQEDKRRHQLHHHLMPNNWHERALGYRFKQPTADKEETRQTKKDKHSIITHSGITKAEIAYILVSFFILRISFCLSVSILIPPSTSLIQVLNTL